MIVQPARAEVLVFKHQLAGKKLGLRKFFHDLIAQLRRFIDNIRAVGFRLNADA